MNISLIKKMAYISNNKSKRKNVNIYIDENDLIAESKIQKNKNKNHSYNKKIENQKNNLGVLGSLINNKDGFLKNDLKAKKMKISYSKSKSKDKNNNIKIVLSINNDSFNIKQKNGNINNKDTDITKNKMNLNKNNSCKNSEIQKNDKMKKFNYNFSSSNIKKKKIHLISQIRPKLYLDKLTPNNFKNKKWYKGKLWNIIK